MRAQQLTGPRGSGKSTLAAALAQPAAAGGHVPDGFVHAIAFATSTSTMDTLSSALAGALRVSVDGFEHAVNEFDARLDAAERDGLPALQRRVMGPLRLMKLGRPVRLVIDALDELPEATQQVLRRAVSDARAGGDGQPDSAGVRFVLTARPGAPALPGARPISVAAPADGVIGAYLLRRGIRDEHIALLVNKAGRKLATRLPARRAGGAPRIRSRPAARWPSPLTSRAVRHGAPRRGRRGS
jgi:AAA ATPase domain